MKIYVVQISKSYFPDGTQPREYAVPGCEVWEMLRVRAASRTDAARVAWARRGLWWLSQMRPCGSRLGRRVSLHVSSPGHGSGGIASRLFPILVYEEGKDDGRQER